MNSIDRTYSGLIIVVPIIIGAFLSGIVYLSEGSAIPLTVFQVALITGFLFFVLKKISTRDISLDVYGLELEYILFLALIFLSLVYSPERIEGFFYVIRYVTLLAMTYLIYNSISTREEIYIICFIIVGMGLLIATQNIINIYLNPEIAAFNYLNEGRKLIRSSGNEIDPNIFASNFIMPIMLLIAMFGNAQSKKSRIIIFIVFSVLISSVLLSYSRSTWIAIFIGVLVIIIRQKKYSIFGYGLVLIILLLATSGTIRSLLMSVLERAADIFAGSSDDSSKFRLILAETAILMWFDSFFMGVGYQGFPTVFQTYHRPQETAGIYEPHNEFYTVLAELGLIGFSVFMIIIWKLIKKGREISIGDDSFSLVVGNAMFASLIAYLVFFQFLGGMQYHTILMINIGLLLCVHKVKSNQLVIANS